MNIFSLLEHVVSIWEAGGFCKAVSNYLSDGDFGLKLGGAL